MPKIKTKRAMAKRMKVRSSGSLKRKKAFKSHILTKKDTKRCRRLRKRENVTEAMKRFIVRAMPYSA